MHKDSKPVVAFDSSGTVIHKFQSCGRAAYRVGRNKRTISAAARGKCKTSAGLAWLLQSDVEKMTEEELSSEIKRRFSKNCSNNTTPIKVSCVIDGERVAFESMADCAEALGWTAMKVGRIVRGVTKTNKLKIQKV